jgi:hypothetical protein
VPVATNLRVLARSYAASPGLAAALILTIGAGAGGNAAALAFIRGYGHHAGADLSTAARQSLSQATILLEGICAVVLLLAAATVTGLLLSRASARARETAVKVSLGSSRRQLLRQSVTESAAIALAGSLAALLVSVWASRLIPLLLFAEDAEQLTWTADWQTIGVTTTIWIAIIAACGAAPALLSPQEAPVRVLRGGSPTLTGSTSTRRIRNGLVIAQVTLCMLLVETAGIIQDDLQHALRTERGRALASLLVVDVGSPGPDAHDGLAYFAAAGRAAGALSGATGAAWIATLPGSRPVGSDFAVEPPVTGWRDVRFDIGVLPPATRTGGAQAASGRTFRFGDSTSTCRVAVINRSAADAYFSGDAIGRLVKTSDGQPVHIIGVLPASGDPKDLDASRPQLYFAANQNSGSVPVGRDVALATPVDASVRPRVEMDTNVVSPDYFSIFADPPVAGRALNAGDDEEGCRVGTVSQDAAQKAFGGAGVGGALIDRDGERIDIVGVTRAESVGAAQRGGNAAVFLPLAQAYRSVMSLAVRVTAADESTASAIDVAVRHGGGSRMRPVETMSAHLARTALAPERIASALVTACSVIGLVVSLGGIYALIADHVARRRRDLSVRIALGAGAWRVIFSRGGAVTEVVRLTSIGVLAGGAVAAVGAPMLRHVLVQPDLPSAVQCVAAGLAVYFVVVVASLVPAWRAVTVNPRELLARDAS